MRVGAGQGVVAIGAWMAISVFAVTALAYWDEQRESAAALDDFAQEQATLAEAILSLIHI